MKKRIILLLTALLVPIAVAIAVVRFALPEAYNSSAFKTTHNKPPNTSPNNQDKNIRQNKENSASNQRHSANLPAVKDNVYNIPQTLEEARFLTRQRLLHLQKLTQDEWDKERKTPEIAVKNPPASIEAAIERAQLRLNDLQKMTASQWQQEKQRLEQRNSIRQSQRR